MGILGAPAGSQQAKISGAALMELHKSHYFLTLQWGGAEPNRQFHLIKENSPPRAQRAAGEKQKTKIKRLTEKTTSDSLGPLGEDGREKHESDRFRERGFKGTGASHFHRNEAWLVSELGSLGREKPSSKQVGEQRPTS